MTRKKYSRRRYRYLGAVTLEMAFVLPVLIFLLFGFYEFSRIHMVKNLLNTSVRNGGRYGSTTGVSSEEAVERVDLYLDPVMDMNLVNIIVKDASVYDDPDTPNPQTQQEIEDLPDIELSNAQPRQLFLIQARIRYNNMALLNLPWLGDNMWLKGQVVTRHE